MVPKTIYDFALVIRDFPILLRLWFRTCKQGLFNTLEIVAHVSSGNFLLSLTHYFFFFFLSLYFFYPPNKHLSNIMVDTPLVCGAVFCLYLFSFIFNVIYFVYSVNGLRLSEAINYLKVMLENDHKTSIRELVVNFKPLMESISKHVMKN